MTAAKKSITPMGIIKTAIAFYAAQKILELGRTYIMQKVEEGRLNSSAKRAQDKTVDVASQDSFPASDPPSWTATQGTQVLH